MLKVDKLHDAGVLAAAFAGAVLCDDLFIPISGKEVADAVFPEDEIVVEVKSITKDRKDETETRKQLTKIVNKWAERGVGDRLVAPWTAQLGDFPPQVRNEIFSYLGRRIAKSLEKADDQIAATMNDLWYENATGLVVVVSPRRFGLDFETVTAVCHRELKKGKLPSINAVIVLDAPTLGDVDPGGELKTIAISTPERQQPPLRPINGIRLNWYRVVEQVTGMKTVVFLPPGVDESVFGLSED